MTGEYSPTPARPAACRHLVSFHFVASDSPLRIAIQVDGDAGIAMSPGLAALTLFAVSARCGLVSLDHPCQLYVRKS